MLKFILRLPVIFILCTSLSCSAESPSVPLVIAKMTSQDAFKITPENVVAYFDDLVQLKTQTADEYIWDFEGKNIKDSMHMSVEFQSGEKKGQWFFLQTRLTWAPQSGEVNYSIIREAINKKLGMPDIKNDEPAGKFSSWPVKGYWRVFLRSVTPKSGAGRQIIVLESVVSQGEP